MADEIIENKPSAANCTAGIIIIGDEILKGHTKDTNSYFLLKKLWSLGIKVGKISFLSDDVDEIAHEVKLFSSRFSFVITTGGIGPTHDDVTMAGIAKAFDEDLVLNEELIKLLSSALDRDSKPNFDSQSSYLKMAKVPKSLKLSHGDNPRAKQCNFPLLSVRNVYIFPGVPEYLELEFSLLENQLVVSNCESRFFLRNIYLSAAETEIASILQEVHEKFKMIVHLGSYPDISNHKFKVKLTLESSNLKYLEEAWHYLQHRLPKDIIVKIEGDGCDMSDQISSSSAHDTFKQVQGVEKVYRLLDPADETRTSGCIKGAWAVIQQTLQLYSLDELCISFNGGKDCTVLLHILHAALSKQSLLTQPLKALYIRSNSPLPQAEQFISQTKERYNLNLITMTGNMKAALKTLKETYPSIKATLLGTRRHDPFSDGLRTFSPTDPGWPHYMRVNPILDWHHSDVWSVIRECNISYCSLYDQGYTSLGSAHNTAPNPNLRCEDGSGKYKPAYMLEDDKLERAGRS